MRRSFRGNELCRYCATTRRYGRLVGEVFQQPARSATTSGAVFTPFPSGCGQKGHARRCEALPGAYPGGVSRLAHGLFDSQRISEKQCEQALAQVAYTVSSEAKPFTSFGLPKGSWKNMVL